MSTSTNTGHLRVLFVEDRAQDAELVAEALHSAGFIASCRRVERERDYCAALDENPDIVLCDYALPAFSLERALELLQARDLDIPFIVVSGQVDEEVVAQAIRLGADDYLLKDRLTRLGPAVTSALERRYMRRQARIAMRECEESEGRFRATFEQAAVGIAHTSVDSRYLLVNDKFCNMTGYTRDELLSMRTHDLMHPDERQRGVNKNLLLENKLQTYAAERRYVRKDGTSIWINGTVSLVRDTAGVPLYLLRVIEDVTDRKRAQQRAALLQATMVAISQAEDLDTALRVALQEICASTGWAYGEAWLPDAAGTCLESRAAWHDGSAKFKAFRSNRARLAVETGPGLAVPAFLEQRSRWVADLEQIDFKRRESAVATGFKSWVGIPVVADDKAVALLEFFIETNHEPAEPDLVELVDVVARQLGTVVQRKAAEESLRESEQKFRQLADNIPEIFWMTDESLVSVVYVSAAFERLTGRPTREANSWLAAVHKDDRDRVEREWRSPGKAGLHEIEFRFVHIDGTQRWVRARGFPVRGADGQLLRFAGITEDITERKLAQERLLHIAHYDQLTELPNRTLFNDRLKQAVAQARRSARSSAVLSIDLDRFKTVNETLGHAHGDRLLQNVSERLKGCIRSGDTVGRLGGDEFAMILAELAAPEDAGVVAQNILNALNAPFDIQGAEVYATASVGIAIYPTDGENVDNLFRDADVAMHSAKAAGRNTYRFYRAEMNDRAVEKMQLEGKLRRALERDEFMLHFQPKLDIATGEIAGVEALLRWQSPENGLVSPDQFIPLLEETGLIVPVGEWALRAACAQIRNWREARLAPVPIAVNLSSRQFHQVDFCAVVRKVLHEHGVAPRFLELEVTESAAMQHPEASIAMLRELKSLGVSLAIDDFGTGYSSLSYLKRLPVDTVKIDRSFVTDLASDPDDASIAQAIITMAHTLNLKVVAEGVETASQLSFLSSHACDQMQGYFFSRPVPAAEITEMLRQNRRLALPEADTANGRRRLLLLDDEENVLAALQRLLRRDGYQIFAATNAQAAFEILANHKVGVIVSDQRMPGVTGVDFLRRVKELYPDPVRMVLSGYTDLESVTDAVNQGAIYKFLTKPWEDSLLRAHIAEAFRRYAQVQESGHKQRTVNAKVAELSRDNLRLQILLEERSGVTAHAGVEPTAMVAGRLQ